MPPNDPPTSVSGPAALRLGVLVETDDPCSMVAAKALADTLDIPTFQHTNLPADLDIALVVTANRLELRVFRGERALVGGHGVASDLISLDTTSGPGRSLGQPLLKAVGIRRRNPYRPTVLDVTAGLGEDAWVLAAVGCSVTACERNPITHALLTDGLQRAKDADPDTAGRVRSVRADGVSFIEELTKADGDDRPEVVYLDPMFPPGRKTAERKAMRVLRLISGDDGDADRLLEAALRTATHRVVVKRPRLAPPLAGPSPAVVHKGKSLRFDVYPVNARP